MNTLRDFVQFLITLIEKEVKLQQQLLQIARRKKQLLMKNQVEELVDYLR